MVKTVFVLGAGFTKAFFEKAPLLEDNYNLEELLQKWSGHEPAYRILQQEIQRGQKQGGNINIERLLTRVDSLMPYDTELAMPELQLLRSDIHNVFLERLQGARRIGPTHPAELASFASYCVKKRCQCITFNYDDILDEALFTVNAQFHGMFVQPYWHPDGGYGFFMRPSSACIGETPWAALRDTSILLLKLHGSINWRVKLGYSRPFSIDSIVHHCRWKPEQFNSEPLEQAIESHFSDERFIVPPVLSKGSLDEPILRSIWGKAYGVLMEAEKVIFIGYSFPSTDLAARFLFSEALIWNRPSIEVVNLARDKGREQKIRESYREALPENAEVEFFFDGALNYVSRLNPGSNEI